MFEQSRIVKNCTLLDLTTRISFIENQQVHERALAILASVDVYEITYGLRKKFTVKGFLAVPKQGTSLPCIVHLRGGSRDFGSIDTRQLLWQIAAYAAEGYVVVAPQYPGVDGGDGTDEFGGMDDLFSITKLRDVLKCVPQADITRIGIKGHSRGGLMAYMLLREVSWVRCAVITGAPTDQIRAAKEREGWREHQIALFGRSRAALVRRSPILWASKLPKKTPLLLMHGTADWRVDASQTIRMAQKLYEELVPYRLVLFEGADHAITEYRDEFRTNTLTWFGRYLQQKSLVPNMKLHGG